MDPKCHPHRKEFHKPEQNCACFVRRISKAEDPKLQCYLKKIFSDLPSLKHPSSHRSHVQKISQCLPQILSLFRATITGFFFCCWLSTLFRGLAVRNILNSVQCCDSRCVLCDAWKYGCFFKFVCRIFEGPLFKIQFVWPKSLLWQHLAFSFIPTSTLG